jgi:AraC family transcriptional regulator of adaptative response/methylated-DNA-[protein]-cysteine methyltransferase
MAVIKKTAMLTDAFYTIMGAPPPSTKKQDQILKASLLDTPLGSMVAIASEDALYLLEFIDCRGLEREVERLRQRTKSAIILDKTPPIVSIEQELIAWFNGTLKTFKTPLFLLGSPFQKSVWDALCRIPYGETRSYLQQATTLFSPSACRAIANANGANQIAIVIPCHRVINSNGELGGYRGGIARKQWLIEHEKQYRLSK